MTSQIALKNLSHKLLSVVLALLALVCSYSLSAANASIYIAHQGSDETRPLLTHLIDHLQKTKPVGHTIKQLNTSRLTIAQIEQAITLTQSCVISLGDYSLEKVLAARQATPIFSLLVQREKLDNHIESYARFNVPLSGIYHEQSFQRQLKLAKAINSSLKSVAVLLGSKTRYSLSNYQESAEKLGLSLAYFLVKPQASVQNYFAQLPMENGFLIILNDDQHYSTTDLQSLMLTSNKRKIPMIGGKPSDSVFAALVSVYTPIKSLAEQTAIEVSKVCSGSKLPPANYGKNYVVNVNPHIANFLGYQHLNEAELLQSLKSQEDAL